MEDSGIIALYWARDQEAIRATSEKYGAYCGSIAQNILGNRADAEECVNDTWLKAWDSMPPQRPAVLSAFLGRITRNLSLNRYHIRAAAKRGGGEAPLVLDELAEVVSGGESVEGALDRRELIRAIDRFLERLPPEKRSIFLCRYWYFDPVAEIAARFGRTENSVAVILSRLRQKLRRELLEGGFAL